MLDIPVKIPATLHAAIITLLQTGKASLDNKAIDFSELQHITITDGLIRFNPPVKVSVAVGPVTVRTSIPHIRVNGSDLKVEVNNSPIDIKLKPE
jgi:hypothetical protein